MSTAPRPSKEKACDPCYYQKLKCAFSNDNLQCDRCIRCRRECVSTRPAHRPTRRASAGLVVRPRKTTAARHSSSKPRKPTSVRTASDLDSAESTGSSPSSTSLPFKPSRSLSPLGPQAENMGRLESAMIGRLLHRSNFMDYFVYPKFVDGMQHDMLFNLFSLFDQAKEIYVAMYSAFAVAMRLPNSSEYNEEAIIRRGALAVKRMRSWKLPSTKLEELIPWAGFGMAIIKLSYFALGVSAPPVRRHILNHVHLLGEEVSQGSIANHSLFIYLMSIEINECLIRRQVPVCNVGTWDAGTINMYLGVSLPLLPHLHELCRLSYALHQGTDLDQTHAALDSLERTFKAWQPETPEDFTDLYSSIEIIHMFAQAEAYRNMALLFIHRLRYPFDTDADADVVAETMSKAIFSELHRARSTTDYYVKWTGMPYLVASIEARSPDERESVLRNIDIMVDPFAPRLQSRMKAFLKGLWKIRDSTKGLVWLDLVSCLPPIYATI